MPYLIVFLSILASFLGLEISNPAPANACKPAARVINLRHPNYNNGDLISFDAVPKFSPIAKLRVVCLSTFSSLILEQASDINRCPRNKYGNSPRFPRDPRGVTRSGSKYTDPVIELPYGNVIRSNQLVTRWTPVQSAKAYQITLDNGSDLRSFTTTRTELMLNRLTPGKRYQVTVRAVGDNVDGKVDFNILVLSKTDNQEITGLISSISKLQIPKDERFAMKVAVLAQYNLYDDAIQIVNEELNSVKMNLSLLRTLGNLYVLATRPQEALQAYRQYYEVAQREKNNQALNDASRLIRYVASYTTNTLLP